MKFFKCFLWMVLFSAGCAGFACAQTPSPTPFTNFVFHPTDGINKNPALTSASELTAVVKASLASSGKTDFYFLNHGNAPVYFALADNGKEIGHTDQLVQGAGAHLKISTNNYVGRKIKISCWTPCYPIGPKSNIWWPDNGDFFITIPPASQELSVSLECNFNYPALDTKSVPN